MKTLLAILALTALLFAPAWADDYYDGVFAYGAGDYETAFRVFKPLADAGDARAQYELGNMYRHGHGVPYDHDAAMKWYRRAAERGHADAQYALAVMHSSGWRKVEAEAEHWYRRAAIQGHVDAQRALGSMYLDGTGVPQNCEQARIWYLRAADQGNAVAQFVLGRMHQEGDCVWQDDVRAHKWFSIAARHGEYSAYQYMEELERGMTSHQIAEAQRLANLFVARLE